MPRRWYASEMRLALILILLLTATAAFAEQAVISAAQWPRPVDGRALAAIEPLRVTVAALDKQPGLRLRIRYPGGDAGSAWAGELRDWLVALGVPSARIDLAPGSGGADIIVVETTQASPWQ
jgi:hypothetical protein